MAHLRNKWFIRILVSCFLVPIIPVKSRKLPEEDLVVIIHVFHFQITIARIVWLSEYEYRMVAARRTKNSSFMENGEES